MVIPPRLLALALAALLAACTRPDAAHPALWQVSGPQGGHGWLFGTIHQLPRKTDWRSATIAQALDQADVLVLEIADIEDQGKTQAAFAALSHSPGLPPLRDRISPKLRPALAKAIATANLDAAEMDGVETWAAALILARSAAQEGDPALGVDRALVKAKPAMPRAEFEGAARQLAIFDQLSEEDQRIMLEDSLRDGGAEATEAQLADAWRKGDMAFIAHETHTGMLGDASLRQALYVGRNQAWAAQIEAMLRSGRHPFVAVGAAHLAGDDGLPAMLAAHGWHVVRVQ
ncbi:MAG: hypothetical protein RLZZ136_831 [Pseudomonadota bacterium]|jgi:uncharacterized protein YbaP (TraB family)